MVYVFSSLLSREQTRALGLQEQPYIILIPKSILQKKGIFGDELCFNLVISDNKITLVGPPVQSKMEDFIE